MKIGIAALAVLTTLALASPALAHEPVASAEQVCVEDQIVLTASFDNPGFEGATTVTATDSIDGLLGADVPTPATFTSNSDGPSRAAGTVTFDWSADDGDSGTLEAPYEAVEGCEKPPVVPPPDDNPPPQKPPHEIAIPGGPDQPSPPDSPPADQPNGKLDTLPFSGPPPALPMALIAAGLLGAGFALRRLRG